MKRALMDLQEIDNALTGLARDKSKLDDGSSARAKRDKIAAELAAETDKGHKLGADRSDKEMQLKSAEEKIAKQQTRLMSATSAHEISALERDIKGLGHARSDLDEAILTLMDQGEQSAGKAAELEKQLAVAKNEVTTVTKNYASEITRIQAETATRTAERLAVLDKINPGEKAKYDASAKAHQGIAISKVLRGCCSACGAAILPFTLREAKTLEYPTCENCSRLLFVE